MSNSSTWSDDAAGSGSGSGRAVASVIWGNPAAGGSAASWGISAAGVIAEAAIVWRMKSRSRSRSAVLADGSSEASTS